MSSRRESLAVIEWNFTDNFEKIISSLFDSVWKRILETCWQNLRKTYTIDTGLRGSNEENYRRIKYLKSKLSQTTDDIFVTVNPHPVKLIYLIFHPPEVVGRGSETQLQVGEKLAEN